MDIETSEAIETLRGDLRHLEDALGGRIDALGGRIDDVDSKIDGVEARLSSRIDGVEARLGSRIDGVEARLASRIDSVEARLGSGIDSVDAKIDGVEATLRVEMIQMREDMRHRFEISTESSRDDMRIIAEGLIALNDKVDRLLPPDASH
jgi:hypothetical protein